MKKDDNRQFERFVRDWKKHVNSPPRISSQHAATRVTACLKEPQKPRYYGRLWLVTTAAAVLLILFILFPAVIREPGSRFLAAEESGGGSRENFETSNNLVVLWLDAETPLYMAMNPPCLDKGDIL